MKTTLKKQLEAFEKGIYLDSYGNEDSGCYNFYDWFCKDYALKAKADKLFKQVKRWVKFRNTDTEKVYVFFKNNCPMSGPLYDDFRICDIETGDVIWTVTPKCGHSGEVVRFPSILFQSLFQSRAHRMFQKILQQVTQEKSACIACVCAGNQWIHWCKCV